MKAFLGIDMGGTLVKAALFDEAGHEWAVASASTRLLIPAPGHTERDMEEFWQSVAEVTRAVLSQSKIDSADVTAVACVGHGKGLYLWGKDGKPVRNGIISTDTRAGSIVAKWNSDGTAERVFEKTIQKLMVSQPCALLKWLKVNEPESYANIATVFEAKDYIRFRLTGKALGEMTDYSGTNLMNLNTRAYDDELLSLFGIPEMKCCLPPLVSALEHCGCVTNEAAALTGLKAGTPVAGGMFDIDACAIASGITDEENLCAIAGTWSINEYISKTPVTNKSVAMNSLFCLPEYYLIEESSPTSAGNLEWFVKSVLDGDAKEAKAKGESIYARLDETVVGIAPEDCSVRYLPYLFGAPENPDARACFVGLGSEHTKAHMARAIFEGVVFGHLNHIEKLLKNRPLPGCIRLSGGAANSKVWAQMFADVCGLPVETVPVKELGALGGAMSAAVMAGEYVNLAEAARGMVPKGVRFEPNAGTRELWAKKYAMWLRLKNALAN